MTIDPVKLLSLVQNWEKIKGRTYDNFNNVTSLSEIQVKGDYIVFTTRLFEDQTSYPHTVMFNNAISLKDYNAYVENPNATTSPSQRRMRMLDFHPHDELTSTLGITMINDLEKIYIAMEENKIIDTRITEALDRAYDVIVKSLIWK